MTDRKETGSVSRWIRELQAEDSARITQAQQAIWDRYFSRLAGLARRRLPTDARREADEEDVVLSALDSFFQRADHGAFPDLADRTALWSLLARITAFKATRQTVRERAAKRGGQSVVRESDLNTEHDTPLPSLNEIVGSEPTAEFAIQMDEEMERLLKMLEEPALSKVARLKLEGLRNDEIAKTLGVGLRTVERKLARIRTLWLSEFR